MRIERGYGIADGAGVGGGIAIVYFTLFAAVITVVPLRTCKGAFMVVRKWGGVEGVTAGHQQQFPKAHSIVPRALKQLFPESKT